MSIRIALLLAYITLCITSNYAAMIWCSCATSAYMKQAAYASSRTVALHRQLFYILLFEAGDL